jgi:hypothetical protein
MHLVEFPQQRFNNIVSNPNAMTKAHNNILAALTAYEREHEFARQVTLPVEDKLSLFPGIGGSRRRLPLVSRTKCRLLGKSPAT